MADQLDSPPSRARHAFARAIYRVGVESIQPRDEFLAYVGMCIETRNRMNEEVKRMWQERLLDPKSKQARGWLGRVRGGRCCLGHLCDLAVEQGVIPPPDKESEDNGDGKKVWYYSYGAAHNQSELPDEVVKWAGLDDECDPVVNYRGDRFELSVINDSKRLRLSQIALLLEQL